jgi:hypothetical protein
MEGAQFSWKGQDVDTHRGPPGDYRNLRNPLPHPPKGTEWKHDKETKEWTVGPIETSKCNADEQVSSEMADPGFIEHTVLPSDTFQGICLKYKIGALELRRANGFSGTNLLLAPNRLKIPRKS